MVIREDEHSSSSLSEGRRKKVASRFMRQEMCEKNFNDSGSDHKETTASYQIQEF